MKTINSIRLILSIMAIAAFMLVLKSCKKTDIDAPNNNSAATAKAAAIQAIKAKYGKASPAIVYNVNKTADELFYKNAAGNMVSLYGNSNNNLVARPCIYNCNNTTNPADLTIIYTLDYVQRFYICESSSNPDPNLRKSKISVRWTVSVPFAITNVTPDGVLNTFGKVKFTPPGLPVVILTATANDSNFTVTNLGPAPGCITNTLYAVTYSFTEVANSNFTSGTQLSASLSLSNDCALIGYLSASGYVNAPSFNQNAYLPCNRIDRVGIDPNTGPNNCATAAGNYIICFYPSGLTPIDLHQLEYRKVNSGSSLQWVNQTSPVFWGQVPFSTSLSPTFSPYTGVLNLTNMLNGSGTWLVRYRNVKNGSCNVLINSNNIPPNPFPGTAGANANWGNPALWITEVWPL